MTDAPVFSGADLDAAIPHRAPFRLVDAVDFLDSERVVTRFTTRRDDPLWSLVYAGHYPEAPVTPGVLLCEAAFQAGAVLMARRLSDEGGGESGKVPVVARVLSAKFRRMVGPDEEVRVEVKWVERMGEAFVLRGTLRVEGGEVLRVEFVVTLAERPSKTESSKKAE